MNNPFSLEIFKNSISLTKGRLLGIDFGTYKIGLAMTDESGMLASPHDIYIRRNLEADIKYFIKLILDYKISGIVVGACQKENGDIENPRLFKLTDSFIKNILADNKIVDLKIPFCFYDESFSSHMTNQYLHEHKFNKNQIAKREDKIAAMLILQGAMMEMNCL
jgi:putative Holliday junction resolvase